MRLILITATAAISITLAGCGQSGPLRPAPGAATPSTTTAPAPLPPGAQTPATQNPGSQTPLNSGKDAINR